MNIQVKKAISILAILISFGSIFAQTGTIKIDITGINPKKGMDIKIALYNENGYLKVTVLQKSIKSEGNTAYIELTNIKAGKYAIAVFQDENSDGKMNTNLVGKPTELSGFSNNAQGNFGPPDFEDVAFIVVNDESAHLTIRLI